MNLQKANRTQKRNKCNSLNAILFYFGWPYKAVYSDSRTSNKARGTIYERYTTDELMSMVKIGHRTIAKEIHPDHNGSDTEMAFINQLRDKAENILRHHQSREN